MTTSRMTKWIDRIKGVTYALVAVVAFTILWQAYGPTGTLIEGQLIVKSPQSSGHLMNYVFKGCKNTSIGDVVARGIEGTGSAGYNYPIGIIYGVAPKGCHSTHISLQLPVHMVPGQYKLVDNITFKPNVFRTESYTLTSNAFTVNDEGGK